MTVAAHYTGRRGQQGADHHNRGRNAAPQPAHEHSERVQQPLGHARPLEDGPHQHEQRHGQQGRVADRLVPATRQCVERVGVEHVQPIAHEAEEQGRGRE